MSAGDRPDLSVVVVSHNGCEMALRTLRSATSQAGRASIEWFVVDSGSTDGTPDAIAAEFTDVRLFRRPNIGFAAANNVALPHTSGRHVLLLNPDVEILEGTLEDLVRAMDDRPGVGAASIVHLDGEGRLLHSMRRFSTPLRKAAEAIALHRWTPVKTLQEADTCEGHYGVEWSADWLVGAFLAVRREALEQVGLLDERFFLYAEEKDWCYRIRQKGWDIHHLPWMRMAHYGTGRGRTELLAQLSHSKRLFADKHFGRIRSGAFRIALAAGHALRLAGGAASLAARRPGARETMRGHALALRVVLGLARPPFEPATPSEPSTSEPQRPEPKARAAA